MHTGRDTLGLSSLIGAVEITIEDLEYQSAEIIRVHSGMGAALDGIPTRSRQFWWRISPRVGHQTSICVYDSIVIFDVAQYFEPSQFPFTTLGCVDGGDTQAAVDGRTLFVYELDSAGNAT